MWLKNLRFVVSILPFSNIMNSSKYSTYLFWFSNEHTNFRLAELDSLFTLFKLDRQIFDKRMVNGPYILMDFPDEAGPRQLMSRSFLTHSCYELLASGETLQEVHNSMKNNLDKLKPFESKSFQIRVDSYGKRTNHQEKVALIDTFEYLPLKGRVDLKDPETSLHLLQYYGLDSNNVPPEPYHSYFGRWIVDGQRKLISKINLKDRKFIGNTSMDPLLSLIMANVGLVKENDIVVDPFVGTGSMLVAAGVLNAYALGNDIDYLMVHAKTRSSRANSKIRASDESVRANMKQYDAESQFLDVVVADTSRPLWREDFKFDAIITDPPYGIREATEKIGTDKHPPGFKIDEKHLPHHFPSKVSYTLQDIFTDLLNFASRSLRVGGRIALWIPISRAEYDPNKLPTNPTLQLISNCEQCLTAAASRRLLVYEKTKEPTQNCITEVDGSALMYRFKFFDMEGTIPNKEKREKMNRKFGKASKRGELQRS